MLQFIKKKCSQERLSSFVLTSDPKWTGVAFHYGITSDPLRINFISPYSNKDWSKFDSGSAIDRILFELVEREFKAVYVIKKLFFVLLSFPQRKMFFFVLSQA